MDNRGNQQDPGSSPQTQGPGLQPPVQNSQGPTTPQEPVSKITLEDLYGPSGMAEEAAGPLYSAQNQTSPSPVVSQGPPPPIQGPLDQKPNSVSQPIEPFVSFSQAQPSPQPQQALPVQPPQSNQPVVPVPPSEPPVIPSLPTVGVPQENTPIPHEELPLRKQRIDSSPEILAPSSEQTKFVADEAVTNKTPQENEPSNKKPKGGINKLILFRILFGTIAAFIIIILLLFAVTWISSIFHPSASGKVTLTYWGLWEDNNTMQVAISQFERQNPNIVVNYEKEDPKQYSQRLLTRVQQGNGPDIFTYHSSWLPMVQSILVPLPTIVISKQDLKNNFYPVVRTDLVKNGALYGIPLEVDTLSLFVNNALFQSAKAQVPTTWDTFTATARALTQKDQSGKIKVAGAAIGTYDNITHAPDILTALFAQNGVDIPKVSPKNNASDALSFYTSFASGDSKVWDNTLDPSQLAFSKGSLAMYFGYSWDAFAIKAVNPSLDFSVYPIPHLPGRNTTAASYWVEGVSAKSLHQKEALLFMQFLAQKNTESLLFTEEAKTRLFGEPYARQDLGAALKSNPLVYPFVEQATDATSSFFAGETQDTGLNGQMNGYLGNAVRSVLNNTSAESAVDSLLQGVQQVESQYGSQ